MSYEINGLINHKGATNDVATRHLGDLENIIGGEDGVA